MTSLTEDLEQKLGKQLPSSFDKSLVRIFQSTSGRVELALPPNPREEAIYFFTFRSYDEENPFYSLFIRVTPESILSIAGLQEHTNKDEIYQKLRDSYNGTCKQIEPIELNLFPNKTDRPVSRQYNNIEKIHLISEIDGTNLARKIENVLKEYDAIGFLKGSKDSKIPYHPSIEEERKFHEHECSVAPGLGLLC